MIPEAAVEAAARAHQATCFAEPWESLSDFLRSERLEDARLILEAAAPHLLAEAWDEGSVAGWVESGLPHSWNAENSLRNANPYRPTK